MIWSRSGRGERGGQRRGCLFLFVQLAVRVRRHYEECLVPGGPAVLGELGFRAVRTDLVAASRPPLLPPRSNVGT